MARLPEIPEQIVTERLLIRCPQVTDAQAVYDAVIESMAELKAWMPWATPQYSREGTEENLRQAIAKFITRQDLRYHAHDRATGEFVMGSGLHQIDWSVPSFEIGYWCRTSKSGQGYVTETVRALTTLAFAQLGAARVQIRCDDKNTRSAHVAEACGYRLEGVRVNDARATDGSLRSTRVYALTKDV